MSAKWERQRHKWQRSANQLGILRQKKKKRAASSSYSGSEERCGDSFGWAWLGDGRLAAVLSDGTGKGERAARESGRAVNATLGLLKAGTDPELALQILNLILSMDNRKEQFPTMDLALHDPRTRELYIYKIGAAPTVLVRAPRCRPGTKGLEPPERIEILTAPAMPMGVSSQSEIPCLSTIVMPGDRIVMMSDGIADSKRDDPELKWLGRLLGRIKSRDLQIISDLIIREATVNYADDEKDDMTVIVIEV